MSNNIIDRWVAAKAALDAAKALENELRIELVKNFSQVGEMHSGTENVPVWGGKLKFVHKLNYSFTCDNDGIDKMLDAIEKSQEGGNVIAERLVKWEGTLSLSEFKLLNNAQKALVNKILLIKPAAKTVTFEATKA